MEFFEVILGGINCLVIKKGTFMFINMEISSRENDKTLAAKWAITGQLHVLITMSNSVLPNFNC